ncbi:MAG: hypothetical protein R3A10_21665 [Caldilineaceae bacterium]
MLDPEQRPAHVHCHFAAAASAPTTAATWLPINQGLISGLHPDPNAEVGHCVHHIAMHPACPDVLFMQKHWDVMRTDNRGRALVRGERQPAQRFRLWSTSTRTEPDTIYVVPIKSDSSTIRPRASCGSTAAAPAATSGRRSPTGCPRTATSTLRATPWPWTRWTRAASTWHHGRAAHASVDGGDNWMPIVRDLPAVLSVEVQTLP